MPYLASDPSWFINEKNDRFRFWKRAGYVPLYVRQTTSELTGEHTCVMVRGLNTSVESELEWLREFVRGRFVHLRYFLFGLTCP